MSPEHQGRKGREQPSPQTASILGKAPPNGTNSKLSTGLKGGPKRVETAGHCCQIETTKGGSKV